MHQSILYVIHRKNVDSGDIEKCIFRAFLNVNLIKRRYLWKYIEASNSPKGSPARNAFTAVTQGSNTSLLPTI